MSGPTKAELQRQLADAHSLASALQADLEVVADRIREEAIQREWCSEYDKFVDNLNGDLSLGKRTDGTPLFGRATPERFEAQVILRVSLQPEEDPQGWNENDLRDTDLRNAIQRYIEREWAVSDVQVDLLPFEE